MFSELWGPNSPEFKPWKVERRVTTLSGPRWDLSLSACLVSRSRNSDLVSILLPPPNSLSHLSFIFSFPKYFFFKCLLAMRETLVWPLGWEDPLEKEMATHSSTLAWKIPWIEKPGRLQSMRSQRVRHNWATSLSPCIKPRGYKNNNHNKPDYLPSRNMYHSHTKGPSTL